MPVTTMKYRGYDIHGGYPFGSDSVTDKDTVDDSQRGVGYHGSECGEKHSAEQPADFSIPKVQPVPVKIPFACHTLLYKMQIKKRAAKIVSIADIAKFQLNLHIRFWNCNCSWDRP